MRRGSESVASGLIVSGKDEAGWLGSVESVKEVPTTEGNEERCSDD